MVNILNFRYLAKARSAIFILYPDKFFVYTIVMVIRELTSTGMDLLGGGGGGGVRTPPSPGQGGAGGGAIFHDEAKNY
jgi:hypothetical protein